MPYLAGQVANYFIDRGQAEGVIVDPLKIQKLVYLSHGWHLAFVKTPLISETIEAWKYGPVVPELYREFRDFGSSTINKAATVPASATPLNSATLALLDQVWNKYGRISGVALSAITHEPGYAWDLARRGSEGGWANPTIPNDWIKDEFERRSKG